MLISHCLENYEKYGTLLGLDLVGHPEITLQPDVSLVVIVHGMAKGRFTGKKLSDYIKDADHKAGFRHFQNVQSTADTRIGLCQRAPDRQRNRPSRQNSCSRRVLGRLHAGREHHWQRCCAGRRIAQSSTPFQGGFRRYGEGFKSERKKLTCIVRVID